jgi:signal transduction histidine kinase
MASDAPASVRETARRLMASADSFFRRAVSEDGVEIVRLDAVPIRLSYTRISELLGRTMDAFVQQARAAEVELCVERVEGIPETIFVDGEKVAWALGALIGNAIRHAADGARRPGLVHVRMARVDRNLVVTLDDSGPGIPPDRARWLFAVDPVSGRSAGTALRLVADVVTGHRGTITAGPNPSGQGARFTIRLPL